MPRYARAVLGGTFDHLHVGHEALLATAFRLGRTVAIGLTTESYLAAHSKPGRGRIQPFAVRRRTLLRWLEREFPARAFEIRPLQDRFGRSVERGVGVLVVSADTVDGGRAVNHERRRRNVPQVPVAVVPLVLADDLLPVSSRRIRSGEIDRRGRRRSTIPIALEVGDRRDVPWVSRAIRSVFPRARLLYLRSAATGSSRRTETGAAPPDGLAISVSRRASGGWTVRESSDRIRLPARALDDATPALLSRGLRQMLRPGTPGL
ncbi:MAG TPA: pantetheine-phosphate adenylyltransferase [Thermoplasmata archaeon]|nr:pantetheine-phosphate adenylyltransferase [Thermoplasmata archaeon]